MVEITVALVRDLVNSRFPRLARLPISPVEPQGWDNRTYRLGNRLAVRLPSAACYALQVEKEHRFLPYLANRLPLSIPESIAVAAPTDAYPFPWSLRRWIPGTPAATPDAFALPLAEFLNALHAIPPAGGPPPGDHNFHRGGDLAVYNRETREAIDSLAESIDGRKATTVWQTALDSRWNGSPVWVHGDVSAQNLLLRNGRLVAVIDFGCCAVGDPACDLTIAWTLFTGESRDAFRSAVHVDDATWARARGWALWKALITVARNSSGAPAARRVLSELLVCRPTISS